MATKQQKNQMRLAFPAEASPSLPQSEKLIIYIKYIRHLRQNYGHYILSGLESFGF